jgi:hypothetical protein
VAPHPGQHISQLSDDSVTHCFTQSKEIGERPQIAESPTSASKLQHLATWKSLSSTINHPKGIPFLRSVKRHPLWTNSPSCTSTIKRSSRTTIMAQAGAYNFDQSWINGSNGWGNDTRICRWLENSAGPIPRNPSAIEDQKVWRLDHFACKGNE